MLILRSCGVADRQIFQQNVSSHIYEIGLEFFLIMLFGYLIFECF